MTTTIDIAFIKEFEADVYEAYQRKGSALRGLVRTKTGVRAKSAVFNRVGKGVAGSKSRNGLVPVMNVDHGTVEVVLVDKYAADWVDRLDELKTNIDERQVLANAGAWALGRATDEQILDAAAATATAAVPIVTTNSATAKNSFLKAFEVLDNNDVPLDSDRFGIVSPRMWSWLLNVNQFVSADYIDYDRLPFKIGGGGIEKPVMWNGHLIFKHTALQARKIGNLSFGYFFHRTAIAQAIGQDITTDITWHGDRAAHFVDSFMSMGAGLIDGTGVVPVSIDESVELPSS